MIDTLIDTITQLNRKAAELTRLIERLKKNQEIQLPGKLLICGTKSNKKYYRRNPGSGKREYLSLKESQSEIRDLAQQEYDNSLLRAAERQLSAIEQSIARLSGLQLDRVYSSLNDTRKTMVNPLFPDRERYIRDWCAVTYPPGSFEESSPEIYSDRKERVRSKSEKIIADRYLHLKQPYRYEYPIALIVNGKKVIFRPDFTVLNCRTLKTYFHQHLGRMDDPDYVTKNLRKLEIFEENGIFLGEQLIITHETSEKPLSTRQLDRLIEKYLT